MRKRTLSTVLAALIGTCSLPLFAAGSGPRAASPAKLAPWVQGLAHGSPALRSRFPSGVVPVVISTASRASAERFARRWGREAPARHVATLPRGFVAAVDVPVAELSLLAVDNEVQHVDLDGSLLPAPPPLDLTTTLSGARALENLTTSQGMPLTGAGMTVCDIDSGIDVFHPLFFHADGATYSFTDVNGNGLLDPGIDTVDVGTGAVTLRAINGLVLDRKGEAPLLGSEGTAFDPRYDYFYADENGNGQRDFGPAAGFNEQTPAYGEPLFVFDDADGNLQFQVDEKLKRLATSKIKVFRLDAKDYRRGKNLIEAPWEAAMQHGTAVGSILVGGHPGLGRLVGMAPDADLIMATDSDRNTQLLLTKFCVDEGAQVVLHEYAPWVGYDLDGSSPLESYIDTTNAMGIVHANPAGNLSGSKKFMEKQLPSGATSELAIRVPALGAQYLQLTLLYREDRALDISVRSPTGATFEIVASSQGTFDGDVEYATGRQVSPRGTQRAEALLYRAAGALPSGDYSVVIVDSQPELPPLRVIAAVGDEKSGWSLGAHFPVDSTEDYLIGWPGTADRGMAIAAYTAHPAPFQTEGARASYSGRGHRIDGYPLMWISGPANPISAARFHNRELSYMVFGGTSGSSPHVAGAAALILQAFPALTGDQVKEKLRHGAQTDAHTGAVPNDDWGYGKVNAYRSIFGGDVPQGSAPTFDTSELVLPVGTQTIPVPVRDADTPLSDVVVEWDNDYDLVFDQLLPTHEIPVELTETGTRTFRLRATDDTGFRGNTLLRVRVVEPEPEPTTGAVAAGGGTGGNEPTLDRELAGGGCSIQPRRRGSKPLTLPWLWAGALCAVLSARRLRRSGGSV